MKNAITVVDRELIDYFDEELPHCSDVRPTKLLFCKINELHRMAKDLIEINAELKKQSQWISVDDELPEVLQKVITSITNDSVEGLVSEAVHQMEGEFICVGEIASRRMRPSVGVTHWMPLPTPPEGE